MATAIVLAGGAGVRMGAGRPKALLPLAGRPLAAWSIAALAETAEVGRVVLVVPPGREEEMRAALGPVAARLHAVVAGGSSRADSLRAGLAAAPPGTVLVHDAARPLVTAALASAVLAALPGADGAIAATPLADTLKRARPDGTVEATLERAGLWRAETPQAFEATRLARAAERAAAAGRLGAATDCASLVEADGGRVVLVPSPHPNPKVTVPADLELAARLLAAR